LPKLYGGLFAHFVTGSTGSRLRPKSHAATSEQKELMMGVLEDGFKGGNIVTGIGLVIGAAVIAPIIIPVLRPVAKSLIKAGFIAYEQGRAAVAELNEQTSDLVAEARAELSEAEQAAKEGVAEGTTR
jgi:Protein of unknown function (DUF5132)